MSELSSGQWICQVPALWPTIRCMLNSNDYKVQVVRELTCGEREKDPQEEELQQTVKDDEGATQLQAFLVLGSICIAGRMQFLLLPEFDSFAKLSVAAHNPYLSSSSWHWRAAGLDHDVQEFNEELVSWELDPQEEEVQHAGQDNGGTIHRYDAMVRREWVPLLQACLVFGSICTAGLLQLLLLPVFDPCANFRVVDHNLPSSIWHWCAAGFDLLSPDLHWLGTWRSPHWLHSDIEPCQYLQ